MSNNSGILTSLFFKLDFRDRESSGRKRIAGILFIYLLSNTILSFNFYSTFDELSYIILSFTSNLFLLTFVVLSDIENVFLGGKNDEILRTLPISTKNIVISRFLSSAAFLLVIILTASVPQVIFFYLLTGNILQCILFVVMEILFCYFIISILILIYVLLLKLLKTKAALLINVMQILYFGFVFYSSSISAKNSGISSFYKKNILEIGFVKFLPQYFFAEAVYNISYLIIALFISVGLFFTLYLTISKNYYRLSDIFKSMDERKIVTKEKKSFLPEFFEKIFAKNNYERASFSLTKDHLQNSRSLKLKYYPMMLMPLVVVLTGIVFGITDFLFLNPSGNFLFTESIPVISPSITFTLIMCARLLLSNTKILGTGSSDTVWIYDSLPIASPRKIILGTNKFIYVSFILPLVVVIFILLSFKAAVIDVLLNILFISAAVYFIGSVNLFFDKTYPFTIESSKFNSASRFTEVIISLVLGIIMFLIQIFIFQNTIFVLISIGVLIIVSMLLNRN